METVSGTGKIDKGLNSITQPRYKAGWGRAEQSKK